MRKLIKSLSIFCLVIAMICSSFVCVPVKASEDVKLKWRNTVDEYGYPVQELDMTEDELRAYQIAQLKKKYEHESNQRTSGYAYTYEHDEDIYDSTDQLTKKILVGKAFDWEQRGTLNCPLTVSFELRGSYKAIEAALTISGTTSQTYTFENYENCLGIFARITTSRYKITKTDKYSGTVVSVTYENIMSTMSKSVRKIYNKESNIISYQNGTTWHNARMLKSTLTNPPTSENDITTATTTVFYD